MRHGGQLLSAVSKKLSANRSAGSDSGSEAISSGVFLLPHRGQVSHCFIGVSKSTGMAQSLSSPFSPRMASHCCSLSAFSWAFAMTILSTMAVRSGLPAGALM
jgi:hypothetical protein